MLKNFKSVIANESGVTMIEYGLIAALIAVVAVTVIASVGSGVSSTFSAVANAL